MNAGLMEKVEVLNVMLYTISNHGWKFQLMF
jgi:hypothetical protein